MPQYLIKQVLNKNIMAMIAVMCYESIGAEQLDADTVNNEIMPTPECLYEVISLRYIYYKGLNKVWIN